MVQLRSSANRPGAARLVMDASSELPEHRTIDDAALWHVDLADIAKQTDVPTELLLDALITSGAPAADAEDAAESGAC